MNPIHRPTGPEGERVCAPCRFILWLADPDRRMPAFRGLHFSARSRLMSIGVTAATLLALSAALLLVSPAVALTLILTGLATSAIALSRAAPAPMAVEHQPRRRTLGQRGAR